MEEIGKQPQHQTLTVSEPQKHDELPTVTTPTLIKVEQRGLGTALRETVKIQVQTTPVPETQSSVAPDTGEKLDTQVKEPEQETGILGPEQVLNNPTSEFSQSKEVTEQPRPVTTTPQLPQQQPQMVQAPHNVVYPFFQPKPGTMEQQSGGNVQIQNHQAATPQQIHVIQAPHHGQPVQQTGGPQPMSHGQGQQVAMHPHNHNQQPQHPQHHQLQQQPVAYIPVVNGQNGFNQPMTYMAVPMNMNQLYSSPFMGVMGVGMDPSKALRKRKRKNRLCAMPGCEKNARGRTQYCVRHGGGVRCSIPGCEKGARPHSQLCSAHGGGHRCLFTGCSKGALAKSVYCRRHGKLSQAAKASIPGMAMMN